MKKPSRLKQTFNRFSAALLLSAGIATGAAPAADVSEPLKPTTCASFPDFKKPETPMHRISRDIPPDPVIKDQQSLLRTLGLPLGIPDGRAGPGTRHSMREFLLFYGPLYGVADYNRELNAHDVTELRRAVDQARADAVAYDLPVSTMAALRLAADRTGVGLDKLTSLIRDDKGRLEGMDTAGASSAALFQIGHAPWLALVKAHGAKYGLGFYADHITLEKQSDGLHPEVANPFIQRQILNLKSNPRLTALLAAEYIAQNGAPPLVAKAMAKPFDPEMKETQAALATLGFDIGGSADGIHGTMTDISIREYQILYGSGIATGKLSRLEQSALMETAARARADADIYDVPATAVGVIRMASDKSNIGFGYMMELAAAESSFSHIIRSKSSSATGLYQFIESTWHTVLHDYGRKYGLGDLAGEVTLYTDDYGRSQARIDNPLIRGQVLEMRKNPLLSALFSADFQLENRARQLCYLQPPLSRTDMYLAHFLGAADAVYFIDAQRKNGAQSAVKIFPEAAEYNIGVFYETEGRKHSRERSLDEVYNFFSAKFNKGIYDDRPQDAPVAEKPPARIAAFKAKKKNAPLVHQRKNASKTKIARR